MSYPTKLPKLLSPGFDTARKPNIPCDSIIDAYYHYIFDGAVVNLGKHEAGQTDYTQIGTAPPILQDGSYAEDATTSYIEFPIESNMSSSGHWAGMLMIVRFKNLIAIGDWTGIFASSTAANANLWYLDKRAADTYNVFMGSVGSASTTLPSWVKAAGSDVTVIYASKQASTAQKHNTKMIFLNNKTGEYQVEDYSAADTWSGDGATDHIMMLGESESAYGVIDSTVFTHFSLQENIFGLNEELLISYAKDLWGNTLKPKVETLFITGTAAASQTITPAHLTSNSQVYAPTVQAQNLITPAHLASASQVYAPTVQAQQLITPTHLTSNAQVYEPTLAFASQTITPDALASSSQVYEPTVQAQQLITPAHLDSNSQIYEPTLATTQIITPDTVLSSSVIYQPQLTGGKLVDTNTGGWESRGNYDFLNPIEKQEVEEDEKQSKQPVQVLPGIKLEKKLEQVNSEIRKAEKSINTQPVKQQEETKDYLIKLYIELNALQEEQRRQEELDIAFISMMLACA